MATVPARHADADPGDSALLERHPRARAEAAALRRLRTGLLPAAPILSACGSRAVSVFSACGRATLYSYAIQHRAAPGSRRPTA